MICIPIAAATNRKMFDLLRRAEGEPADLHELRLDALDEPPRVEELVAASSRPVIATCRSLREGGGFSGGDDDRRRILLRAAGAGAAYLDAEPGDVPHLGKRGGAILIASTHDFSGTPDDLDEIVARLASLSADWVKFAVAARSQADNLRVFSALAACPKPCIGIAMGEMGLPSRILGPARGSRVTFGSLDGGLESAPGQPTARQLAELYRVGSIGAETAVYGLLGNPVAQSPGFRLHNTAFALLGLDAVYIPFLVEDAPAFLRDVVGPLNVRGLSVTIPHKHAALAWADSPSEAAVRIGAANTLTCGDGGWKADNTDCLAVLETIREAAEKSGAVLASAPALVLGAGGAARAVGMALMLLGCRVTLAARDAGKAEAAARELGWEALGFAAAFERKWRVIANTTPIGMVTTGGVSPFPAHLWRPDMLAFDVVHNPPTTRFLEDARAAGAATATGWDMFVRQAAGQFRLWTGRGLPPEAIAVSMPGDNPEP